MTRKLLKVYFVGLGSLVFVIMFSVYHSGFNSSTIVRHKADMQRESPQVFLKDALTTEDGRKQKLKDLAQSVQNRLRQLQNPKDCSASRLYICRVHSPCGLGCTLHHIGPCFFNAIGMNRTMVVEHLNDWFNVPKDMEVVYQPFSETCLAGGSKSAPVDVTDEAASSARVVVQNVRNFYRPFTQWTPFTVPDVLLQELWGIHSKPDMWWVGQIHAYLTRFKPEVKRRFDEIKANLNFTHPIVGVQVRRTDKTSRKEGKKFELSDYMVHVEKWFNDYLHTSNQQHVIKRVFLATDEPQVYQEALKKYPQYTFHAIPNHIASANKHRYTSEGMRGIAYDLEFLSSCDFLVCTFSSNVGRLAYELMYAKNFGKIEAVSLDLNYLYNSFRYHQVTVESNINTTEESVDLRLGDVIYLKENLRNHKTGNYPESALKNCPWPVKYEGFDLTTQSRGIDKGNQSSTCLSWLSENSL